MGEKGKVEGGESLTIGDEVQMMGVRFGAVGQACAGGAAAGQAGNTTSSLARLVAFSATHVLLRLSFASPVLSSGHPASRKEKDVLAEREKVRKETSHAISSTSYLSFASTHTFSLRQRKSKLVKPQRRREARKYA